MFKKFFVKGFMAAVCLAIGMSVAISSNASTPSTVKTVEQTDTFQQPSHLKDLHPFTVFDDDRVVMEVMDGHLVESKTRDLARACTLIKGDLEGASLDQLLMIEMARTIIQDHGVTCDMPNIVLPKRHSPLF